MRSLFSVITLAVSALFLGGAAACASGVAAGQAPGLGAEINQPNPFVLILLTAIIALFPIVIGLATAYLKVSIVLNLLRSAIGTQHVPSGLVTMALSLALTLYIMQPVLQETAAKAAALDLGSAVRTLGPSTLQMISSILTPWRDFLLKHAGKKEIQMISGLNRSNPPGERDAAAEDSKTASAPVHISVLLPAFILSELKEAFAMGFALLLPFLAVDMIVANLLVGMGMYMVSPVMIALPLKLLLFVAADGWILVAKGLVSSYQS